MEKYLIKFNNHNIHIIAESDNKYDKLQKNNDKIRINKIYKILKDNKEKELTDIIKNLYKKKVISDVIQIKDEKKEKTLFYKLLISKEFFPKNSSIYKDWISAWHGTDFSNLESIIRYGLKLPGTKLEDGRIITSNFEYQEYELKGKVQGIKNWENAIFASPDIMKASKYSNEIGDKNKYNCLIKVKIKPKTFTKLIFSSKSLEKCPCLYEDGLPIYRIASEKNIVVKSIVFRLLDLD